MYGFNRYICFNESMNVMFMWLMQDKRNFPFFQTLSCFQITQNLHPSLSKDFMISLSWSNVFLPFYEQIPKQTSEHFTGCVNSTWRVSPWPTHLSRRPLSIMPGRAVHLMVGRGLVPLGWWSGATTVLRKHHFFSFRYFIQNPSHKIGNLPVPFTILLNFNPPFGYCEH